MADEGSFESEAYYLVGIEKEGDGIGLTVDHPASLLTDHINLCAHIITAAYNTSTCT